MKKTKKLIEISVLLFAICFTFLTVAPAAMAAESVIPTEDKNVLYSAEDVALALMSSSSSAVYNAEASNTILSDVLMPTSMGIEIPNINMDKIVKDILLSTLDPAFEEELAIHGVEMPETMTLSKYYTYLHMSSITAGSTVTAGSAVGKQGKEGNATGYHVHFEVHTGNTTSLSKENDHVLGSVSPYRIQDYIGELDD